MSEAAEGGEGGGGVDVEQLQAQINDLSSQLGKVKSKNEELLTEKKTAQQKAREAEEAKKFETEEKLKASSNYKELHKSSEQERQKLLDELTGLKTNIATEKKTNAAMKLAAELAEGDNVDLLAEFVTKRLKFTDGNVSVVNQAGELTVSTLADLKNEFQNDPKFAALLKGNQSSGGSASGGGNSSGAAQQQSKLTSTQRIAEGLKNL